MKLAIYSRKEMQMKKTPPFIAEEVTVTHTSSLTIKETEAARTWLIKTSEEDADINYFKLADAGVIELAIKRFFHGGIVAFKKEHSA